MNTGPTPTGLTKLIWLMLGWCFVVIGIVGVVLPGLPTTGPLLLALACFSKSSERLRTWLLEHRVFGPPLKRWQAERTIPLKAKWTALGMMTVSGIGIYFLTPFPGWGKGGILLLILIGAVVVLRIPHSRRETDDTMRS